jgi:4,5-dihydroxyphthalate decarboxylase
VRSDLVDFNVADVKVSNTQFKPLVREQKYDMGELATITYLMAYERGTPYVLLPGTVVGRNQHHRSSTTPNAGRSRHAISRQARRRAGLHADHGAWVRGFLARLRHRPRAR